MLATHKFSIVLYGEKKQLAFGRQLGRACQHKNCVIYLQGELGAGKTTLARGFLQEMGFTGRVKSPTYTLVETYDFKEEQVLHIDLYRIRVPEEVFDLGLHEKEEEKKRTYLIEWPEKALKELPLPDITCYIAPITNKRHCLLTAHTDKGQEIMGCLRLLRSKNRGEI